MVDEMVSGRKETVSGEDSLLVDNVMVMVIIRSVRGGVSTGLWLLTEARWGGGIEGDMSIKGRIEGSTEVRDGLQRVRKIFDTSSFKRDSTSTRTSTRDQH